MQDLKSFVKIFTEEEIPATLHSSTYYTPGEELEEGMQLAYMTEKLGVGKRKKFTPTRTLLEKILPLTNKIAIVNEKAAWMFICDNNILKEGIVECNEKKGYVIVVNERHEVLGYGKITGAGITNEFDIGSYLR